MTNFNFDRKKILTIFILTFLLVTLPLAVFLVKESLEIRRQAVFGTVDAALDPATKAENAGTEFPVAIKIKAGAKRISGANLSLTYDKDLFEITSLSANLSGPNSFTNELVASQEVEVGKMRLSVVAIKSVLELPTGEITVGTITFKGKKAGTSRVDFTDDYQIVGFNPQGSDFGLGIANKTNGNYEITGATPTLTPVVSECIRTGNIINVTPVGGEGKCHDIQKAIDASQEGDTIAVTAGNYTLSGQNYNLSGINRVVGLLIKNKNNLYIRPTTSFYPCDVDFNGDGVIDQKDLDMITARWRTKRGDSNYEEKYDLDKDGDIDIVDIQKTASQVGKTCERTSVTPSPRQPVTNKDIKIIASEKVNVGILVENSTPLIEQFTLEGTNSEEMDEMIMVKSSRAFISGHIIQNLGRRARAIILQNSDDSSIHSNLIYKTNGGIMVEGSKNVSINLNKIDGGDDHAISINKSSGEISWNTLVNKKGSGISALGTMEGEKLITVKNNTIANNGETNNGGVVIQEGGGALLINNIIVGNKPFGVWKRDEQSVLNLQYNDVWNNGTNYQGLTDQTGHNGNISQDPKFGDSYCLLTDSPCLRTGENGTNMGALGGCGTAYFALEPASGKYPREATFTAKLIVDTAGEKITSADAVITFNKDVLEVIDVAKGDAPKDLFHNIWPDKVYIGAAFALEPKQYFVGRGTMALITFKAKNFGRTEAHFECTPGRTDDSNITGADMNGTDILNCSKIINGFYQVGEPAPTLTPKPCVPEGESYPVYPENKCCEGLTPISPVSPDANGLCPPRPYPIGAMICARCGNGTCGPGENVCNCPEDCGPSSKIKFSIKFNGMSQTKPDLKVRLLVLADITGGSRTFSDITATASPDLIYRPTDWVNLTGIKPGAGFLYSIFIKGPKHLQKKMVKRINLDVGENIFDWTDKPLEPGDLPNPNKNYEQDGKVDSIDASLLLERLNKNDVNSLRVADLNYDGVVNLNDYSLIIQTLSTKYEDED